jgi:hypothetical protein
MSSRYDAYYKSIPRLSRDPDRRDPGETVTAVRAGPTTVAAATRRPSVLETHHPDIVQAVTLLWGYPEMNTYFEKLWLDDGSGNGRPLEPEAMSELMLLASVHHWLTPQRPTRTMASIYDASTRRSNRDVWDDVPRRRR